MYKQVEKSKENKSRTVVNSTAHKKINIKQNVQFVDHRPESVVKRKVQPVVINGSKVKQLIAPTHIGDDSKVVQLVKWTWDGDKWKNEDGRPGAGPRRPGTHVGEIVEYDEPTHPLSLNLGAGQNPMLNLGAINLEYTKEDAEKGVEKGRGEGKYAEYILADATKPLPFRDGVFDEVHAINPFKFNPVSMETSRVMTSTGVLRVTGNKANKYAKNSGSAHEDPEKVRLYPNGISEMAATHIFGTQSHSGGASALDTSSSLTRSYAKGKEITLSEAANSANPQLKEYYDLHTKLELIKMAEREQGYQDDYADDDEYLSRDECRDLIELRKRFGRLV